MPLNTMIALFGFAFVMSISPGPGNFLLLASGANFGLVRTLPLVFGISSGFLSLVLFLGLGLGALLEQHPVLYDVLRVACGAYVLWLALRIARSRSMGADTDDDMDTPIGYFKGAMFQWVNPKAWAVALIVSVTYTSPENFLPSLLWTIAVFGTASIPAIGSWAVCGAGLRRLLSTRRRIAVFNTSMALLLVGAMLPMLLRMQ